MYIRVVLHCRLGGLSVRVSIYAALSNVSTSAPDWSSTVVLYDLSPCLGRLWSLHGLTVAMLIVFFSLCVLCCPRTPKDDDILADVKHPSVPLTQTHSTNKCWSHGLTTHKW